MPDWGIQLLWCLGLVLLAVAFLHSHHAWMRRIGVWIVFGTIGLAVWFWTASILWVALIWLSWFALPVIQALRLSRKLEISAARGLEPTSIAAESFPDLHGLTNDLTAAGFLREGDFSLRPSPFEQYYRLFRHDEKPVDAALAAVRQGGLSMIYMILLSRDPDGGYWVTWNYPLSYGLKMPPEVRLFRCMDAASADALGARHQDFLDVNEVVPSSADSNPRDIFNNLFGRTVQHNLHIGLLRPRKGASPDIGYSWKGSFFVSWQVLRDVIRG